MKHTKEPWYVAHHQFIYAENHLLVGQTACPPALSDNPAATQAINADRIAACVNACAGITNEQLSVCTDNGILQYMDAQVKQLQQDHDRLAALNAELVEALDEYGSHRPCCQIVIYQQTGKCDCGFSEAIAKVGVK